MQEALQIHLLTHGTLALKAEINIDIEDNVDVNGHLKVALGHSVTQALSFLPFLIRRKFEKAFMHREMKGLHFTFRIPALVEISTDVSPEGVLVLSGKYPNFLSRPVAHTEVQRLFLQFGHELRNAGLRPFSADLLERFIKQFKQKDRATLPFLDLFNNKTLSHPGHELPPVENLVMHSLSQEQDSGGDLIIHFQAKGRLQSAPSEML